MQDNRRISGILLHPTSLPSAEGIGDLGQSAYDFIDFLAASGQKLWQILPLGPTGMAFGNSPYMCASAFAGNPLMVSLAKLQQEGLLDKPVALAGCEQGPVDFERVTFHKMPLLKTSFEQFLKQPEKHEPWLKFCAEQAAWLADFALFTALKTYYGDTGWNAWPKQFKERDPAALAEARTLLQVQIQFHSYVQYQFDCQWQRLKQYAKAKGVMILGDLPLYVAYDSADVWSHPELFELTPLKEGGEPIAVAGVPPDYFSETGQLWGNPLYNWPALRRTGYRWWIDRVQGVLRSVDWVRIDHFRGLESYWRVLADEKTAMNGTWAMGPGAELFLALKAALGDLPIVAEDLGVITPEVEAIRDQFGFPGMRILQFAFGSDSGNTHVPFNYVRNCLVYTGTHDNNTCIGWRDDPRVPVHEKQNLMTYLGKNNLDDVNWDLIRLALQSIANTAIFPLQDVLGLGKAHRMNIPNVAKANWAWRYEPHQLNPGLAAWLLQLTQLYGRD
ncbi:4-alpha-glucanotransferase [Candidatus Cyanaurora vandensis]|uniref:4-alpha-glucanotransferase n=1 Tax=Candidatus Cyanaurora vandensis TaxID=2714958 RepID=UPI00257E3353|nr:4-alpha-glucanotransferase [Candidatus Cyanaurora vandensis]